MTSKFLAETVACSDRLGMTPISFKRHRFPPTIIQHAVRLYARLTLSFRDIEELLAERVLLSRLTLPESPSTFPG